MNNPCPAPSSIHVSISVLSQLFLYLRSKGVEVEDFLRSISVDPVSVQRPDEQITIEKYLHIQDSAAEYIHDPYLGLHMGEYAEPGSWTILGYMMMNSRTLGEAFEKIGSYQKIIGNVIEATAHIGLNKIKLIFFTPPTAPSMSRHCFESTLSSTVKMMRSLTGRAVNPLEATFIYPEPDSVAEYQRVFACPVQFEQKYNSLTIPMNLINIPIQMSNPALMEHFEEIAKMLLRRGEQLTPTTDQVTQLIVNHLADEKLSINQTAREMNLSVRTLQNYLKNEGAIFSELVDDIRYRLAQKYLLENFTVEEITCLLGFSETSVFRKSFKKWSGLTPVEFRQQPL